jgi:hypothetical protein
VSGDTDKRGLSVARGGRGIKSPSVPLFLRGRKRGALCSPQLFLGAGLLAEEGEGAGGGLGGFGVEGRGAGRGLGRVLGVEAELVGAEVGLELAEAEVAEGVSPEGFVEGGAIELAAEAAEALGGALARGEAVFEEAGQVGEAEVEAAGGLLEIAQGGGGEGLAAGDGDDALGALAAEEEAAAGVVAVEPLVGAGVFRMVSPSWSSQAMGCGDFSVAMASPSRVVASMRQPRRKPAGCSRRRSRWGPAWSRWRWRTKRPSAGASGWGVALGAKWRFQSMGWVPWGKGWGVRSPSVPPFLRGREEGNSAGWWPFVIGLWDIGEIVASLRSSQ